MPSNKEIAIQKVVNNAIANNNRFVSVQDILTINGLIASRALDNINVAHYTTSSSITLPETLNEAFVQNTNYQKYIINNVEYKINQGKLQKDGINVINIPCSKVDYRVSVFWSYVILIPFEKSNTINIHDRYYLLLPIMLGILGAIVLIIAIYLLYKKTYLPYRNKKKAEQVNNSDKV